MSSLSDSSDSYRLDSGIFKGGHDTIIFVPLLYKQREIWTVDCQ